MTTKNYSITLPSQRSRALDVLGTKVTILAESAATNCFGVTCQEGDEGTGPPPHSHDWDEAFFVLAGEVHFVCGNDEKCCPPGTLVYVPRGTVHGFSFGKGGGR